MDDVDFLTLSETKEYADLLDKFVQLRYTYRARKHHYELDTERGFVEMAHSRLAKLNEVKAEIVTLQPRVKEIVETADKNLAADSKNKRARLLRLYCELLTTAPADLQKVQQKISNLRSQIFKNTATEESEKKAENKPNDKAIAPEQMSLFD